MVTRREGRGDEAASERERERERDLKDYLSPSTWVKSTTVFCLFLTHWLLAAVPAN